eukprot:TRINITY_DN1541_c0_g1_i1.p1 TRINITY_DN1541_c0_g1~~TRINITY_DN1541_c0_g1_i1.p1  ORF type:complete len:436 (-),score=63.79 TRINITY_DN1541_c0_g1_i1:42-1349(-)
MSAFYRHSPELSHYIIQNKLWHPPDDSFRRSLETQTISDFETSLFLKDQVSAEKLTDFLREGKWLAADEKITSASISPLGHKFGLSGNLFLLSDIKYDPSPLNESRPSSLVVKFAGEAGGFKESRHSEKKFYSMVAPLSDNLIVPCYSVFDYKGKSIFLFEFIKNQTCIHYSVGLSYPLTLMALREMARFHAKYRGIDLPLLSLNSQETMKWLRLSFQYACPRLRSVGEQTYEHFSKDSDEKLESLVEQLSLSPFQSIVHNDPWIHNWMFSTDLQNEYSSASGKDRTQLCFDIGHPRSIINGVTLLDWEYTVKGNPLFDVNFFLWSSANENDLKNSELEFLQFYYSQVCHFGVTGYSYHQCLKDYNNSKILAFRRLLGPFGFLVSPVFKDHEHNFGNLRGNINLMLETLLPDNLKLKTTPKTKEKTNLPDNCCVN